MTTRDDIIRRASRPAHNSDELAWLILIVIGAFAVGLAVTFGALA